MPLLAVDSAAEDKSQAKARGILAGLQALQSDFFRPNVLFLSMPEQRDEWDASAESF
jgi:hypothetical protein